MNPRKRIKKPGETTLFCFSPAVMVATFIIEITLAVYIYFQNRRFGHNTLIVSILTLLATFQLSEYMICRGGDALLWSRIGLVSITLLPLLGFVLIGVIRNNTRYSLLGALVALAFSIIFSFWPNTVNDAACAGNYVILNVQPLVHSFYGYYYFGLLLLGIYFAFRGMEENKKDKRSQSALLWMIIGYLSFILPLSLVYIFIAGTRNGIASIMCGFAVIFAFILAFKVSPMYHRVLDNRKKEK